MNAPFAAPTPLHQAALVLHGLAGEDAAWMLEALTAQQRGVLAPLLRDLQALAIPRDARLAEHVVAQTTTQPSAGHGALHALDEGEVASLACLLAAEPTRLASLLLSAERWPWQQQVQHHLGLISGRELVAIQPALREALVEAAALALRAERCADAPAPSTAWARLRARASSLRSRP